MKTDLHTGEHVIFVKHNKSGFFSGHTVLCKPLIIEGKPRDKYKPGSLYITNQRIIFEAKEKSLIVSLGNIDSFTFNKHLECPSFDALDDDGTYTSFILMGSKSIKEAQAHLEDLLPKARIQKAKQCEEHLDYKRAIEIYDKMGKPEEAARVRKIVTDLKKVDQTVVHGDQVTKTEIKDSVVSKSSIGSGGDDKFTKLKELKEMLAEGLIDDEEFKQMKKEILGK